MFAVGSFVERVRSAFARRWLKGVQFVRASIPHRPRPAILMYHRIADDAFNPWALAVTPANFREQLEWLSRSRDILSLREFVDRHRSGTLSANAIALTFDDGYACNAEVAAPLLEQMRVPATIFLPAELIERGGSFWWDDLQEMVLEHGHEILAVDGVPVPIGKKSANDRRWKAGARASTPRQAAFLEVHRRLMRKKPAELEQSMDELRNESKAATAPASKPVMTRQQVRSTASDIVEFGSHALTHPWMTSLDPAEKAREICGSRDRCEELIGTRPVTFAYPFGEYDEESERLVAEAGFACACATNETAVRPSHSIYALPRVQVGDWSAAKLARRLAEL